MKIQLNGKDIELRYTMRALMMYENIKQESFAPKTLQDVMIFFFCVIIASDKTARITFDDLIDMVDDNPDLLSEFSEWLTETINKQNMLANDMKVEADEGKKN